MENHPEKIGFRLWFSVEKNMGSWASRLITETFKYAQAIV